MTAPEVLRELESLGSEQTRKTYRRHGCKDPMFGVSYASFGKLQKRIKVDHPLARALWATGNHDAQVLATMVGDPTAMDAEELTRWTDGISSYALADAYANLAARAPAVASCMSGWMASDDELVGRTGWTVFARRARVDGDIPVAELDARLREIEHDIHTRRNRTREAMNSALISIGVGSEAMREPALAAAARIGRVDVDQGDTCCKTPDATEYIQRTVARQATKTAAKPVAKKPATKTVAKTPARR